MFALLLLVLHLHEVLREAALDGFSQLWFADTAALDAAFASPAGQAAMAHANTFIEEITTFLVEPFVVVDREGELR